MVDFASLKTLFPLEIEEEKALAHIKRARLDFMEIEFKNKDLELEVIGSKAMYYLAPLLWSKMQNRVDEYEESLQTFKDIEKFQAYWLDRSSSGLLQNSEPKKQIGDLLWASV